MNNWNEIEHERGYLEGEIETLRKVFDILKKEYELENKRGIIISTKIHHLIERIKEEFRE